MRVPAGVDIVILDGVGWICLAIFTAIYIPGSIWWMWKHRRDG